MSEAPLISVGILSYNRPDTIGAAIEGIISQTYQNLEILIADNASPDPRVDAIIRSYAERDARIQYTRHKENGGPYYNGSFLRNSYSGQYYLHASDDDVYYPTFIEKMYALHQQGDYALAAAQPECYDMHSGRRFDNIRIPDGFFQGTREENFFQFLALHHWYTLKGPTLLWGLYKRSAEPDPNDHVFGLLKSDVDNFGTDMSWVLHTIAHGNVIFSPEVLWLRQERFYWGPGHEPWMRTPYESFKYALKKNYKFLRYYMRFLPGKDKKFLVSCDIYFMIINKLVEMYGFDKSRAEAILREHRKELICLLT